MSAPRRDIRLMHRMAFRVRALEIGQDARQEMVVLLPRQPGIKTRMAMLAPQRNVSRSMRASEIYFALRGSPGVDQSVRLPVAPAGRRQALQERGSRFGSAPAVARLSDAKNTNFERHYSR